ncbi:hypothetical protein KW807_01295 [Candidatus Parcubacteria bacterium]|nr:hypothetical protein [Candidatus Parcubacteria bacterium]
MDGVYWIAMGIILLLAEILLGTKSTVQVATGFIGAEFRFKKLRRRLKPGLNFSPPGWRRIEYYSTAQFQQEFTTEPEDVDRVNDNPDEGKRSPYRIPHKGLREAEYWVVKDYDVEKRVGNPFNDTLPLSEMKKVRFNQLPDELQEALDFDSVNDPITTEIPVVVSWSLKTDSFDSLENFIANINPASGRDRIQEVHKRMEDEVSQVLQAQLGALTAGHSIYMAASLSPVIKEKIKNLVGDVAPGTNVDKPWGIQINEAFLKLIHLGSTFNKARSEARSTLEKAQAQAEATQREAESKANATRLQAAADEEKKKADGRGEAARLTSLLNVVKANPEEARFILGMETTREGYAAYRDNKTVGTYAPGLGANPVLPLTQ